MCQLLMLRALMLILKFLPHSWNIFLSKKIFRLGYWFSPERRKNIEENLSILFCRKNVRKEAQEVFASFGRYLVEFLSPFQTREHLLKSIRHEGTDHLLNASQKGKGAIAVTGHLGNWEMAAAATARLGLQVSAVFFSHPDPSLNQLFLKQREVEGLKVIPWKKDAAQACLEALRKGETVAIAGDIDFLGTGIDVEFFGKRTKIPRGPIVFSKRTGASIVPGAYIWEKDSGLLFFDEAIDPQGKTEFELAQKIAASLEKMIQRDPTQWICFEKMWK